MKFVSDLHIHSKFSRAVSPRMQLENIAHWAEKKGIDLVATGDWSHPIWIRKIKSQLEEKEKGIYQLENGDSDVKFMLSTEMSSIYSQGNKTRRIHNLVLVPSFDTAEKVNKQLLDLGANLESDGRPTLGLSAKELAELVWSVDKQAIIIPAHVWTPWYAMYGSKSGFDSIKDCFGKYAQRIYAVETGLSSDPEMNWQVEELDKRALVSFSDAHSPSKLGRELTVFQLEKLTFSKLAEALKARKKLVETDQGSVNKIVYTIEFYPQEGKYHYSGHRKCDVCYSPEDIDQRGTTCPVCGKTLTLGVVYRVRQLADRQVHKQEREEDGLVKIYNPEDKHRPPYVSLVPLVEILSEVLDVGVKTKTVKQAYQRLVNSLGSELEILTTVDYQKIKQYSKAKVAQAIKKVRERDLVVKPGYDGLFGEVTIWGEKEADNQKDQMLLFK